MGVDLAIWLETIKKNPLKFKFEGLDGWHTDVREAAVRDERFMENYMLKEAEDIGKEIEDFLEPYCVYLMRRLDWLDADGELVSRCRAGEYSAELMTDLEEAVGERRSKFACFYVDPEFCWDHILDDDPQRLLEKHPAEEVWNEAYGCGFDIDRVVYICPSCGSQAMTIDELRDNGGRHYCSLCGSEYMMPHCFTQSPDDLFRFWWDLGIEPWPFGLPAHVGEQAWWEDPDKSTMKDDCSGWRTITGLDDERREVTFDHGTAAPFDEVIPKRVWDGLSQGVSEPTIEYKSGLAPQGAKEN